MPSFYGKCIDDTLSIVHNAAKRAFFEALNEPQQLSFCPVPAVKIAAGHPSNQTSRGDFNFSASFFEPKRL